MEKYKYQFINVNRIFKDIRKGLEFVALKDFNLSVKSGEFICLLGPSGCGKTTALNLLAGYDYPSKGQVFIDGKLITKPGIDRGVVLQEPTLFPWLKVKENITFGPKMLKIPQKIYNEKALEYISLVGLKGFDNHYPYELSGGMKQRVAIARAWINEPSVLLMDEPFGALDAQTRLIMQELLLNVWDKLKTTILFITHDVDEALCIADRVFIMTGRPGRIKKEIKILFKRPRNLESLLFSHDFIEIKKEIVHVIKEETLKVMYESSAKKNNTEGILLNGNL